MTDYAQHIVAIRALVPKLEAALNARDWRLAYMLTAEIETEAADVRRFVVSVVRMPNRKLPEAT